MKNVGSKNFAQGIQILYELSDWWVCEKKWNWDVKLNKVGRENCED